MLSHYLKTALRSILRRKFYSFVAAASLAIGLAVAILILAFVRFENSFDAMHFDSERVYRLNWATGDGSHFATFMNPASPIMATAMPEIESFTRLALSQQLFTVDGVDQYQQLSMVDNDFFGFFNYEILQGDPAAAIRDLSSAVITEAAAIQLFSTVDAIGRTFTVDGEFDFRIAAVIADNPGNSHLVSNIYLNIENLPSVWRNPGIWENMGSDVMYHYVRLVAGVDPQQVAENALDFFRENGNDEVGFTIHLQPLRMIHFTPDLQNEMTTRDGITAVVKPFRQRSDLLLFTAVAVLTLVIAAFNFMNLQVVQLIRRAREIGIRRVSGSSSSELAGQFLVETAVISGLALLMALTLCAYALPVFNRMVATTLTLDSFFTTSNVLTLTAMAFAIGLLAGFYPAVAAARLTPTQAIRGELIKGDSRHHFRSTLLVAQFSISIGLIIAGGIVNLQINYAMQKSLGFDPANIVTVELPNQQSRRAYDVMREELLAQPGVVAVSAGTIIPTRDLSDGGFKNVEGGDPERPLIARMVTVSDDYFSTLGMDVVAGRALSFDYPTDPTADYSDTVTTSAGAIMLNEAAARSIGFTNPEDAIGTRMSSEGAFRGQIYRNDSHVVGIVKDAHYQSVRSEIVPVFYQLGEFRRIMIVKLAEQGQQQALSAIDRSWQQQVPEFPIQRSFLSDSYSAFYSGENRTFILFIGLSAVAIVIACLGLYALASSIAERRRKEMSIRKVLGATIGSIVGMLTWDFSKLVILANILAWPLAWWSMQQWLQNFAYRTDINVAVFLFAGVTTLILAMITTIHRAWGIAASNPVNALRSE